MYYRNYVYELIISELCFLGISKSQLLITDIHVLALLCMYRFLLQLCKPAHAVKLHALLKQSA